MGIASGNPGQIYLTAPCPQGSRYWEHSGGATPRMRRDPYYVLSGLWGVLYEAHLTFNFCAEGKHWLEAWAGHILLVCLYDGVQVGEGFRTNMKLNTPRGNLFSFHITVHKF